MQLRRRREPSTAKKRRWTGTVPYFAQLRQDMFRNPWRYSKKKKR
jgi:hypothetical protein